MAQSKISINGVDGSKYSNKFYSSSSLYSQFKSMIGDTIVFEGSASRRDFFKSDTVWIKSRVKKPVFGKHYKLTTYYKCTSDNYSDSTDGKFIFNQPWQILDIKKGFDGTWSSHGYECMVVKNLTSGDVVTWKYKNDFDFVEGIAFKNISLGKKVAKTINKNKLFEKKGVRFDEISIASAIVTVKFDYIVFLTTTVKLSNNETYVISENDYEYNKLLYDESNKLIDIEKMRNLGTYSLELVKVQKPKNPQIRYGKMTTISDKSVTKYSYVDNLISIIWCVGKKEFSFILENKSGNTIKIVWDDASYIDILNSASRIFHSGVKYADRDKSMPATVVPNGTSFTDVLLPTNLTYFSDSDWYSDPLISNPYIYDESKVGKTVKVLLPISVKGVVNEYTYTFKIKWNWKYPELRD